MTVGFEQPSYVVTAPNCAIAVHLSTSIPIGITIGIQQTLYSVSESDGFVTLGIAVLSGESEDNVEVRLFTEDGTALGIVSVNPTSVEID